MEQRRLLAGQMIHQGLVRIFRMFLHRCIILPQIGQILRGKEEKITKTKKPPNPKIRWQTRFKK
jgi:hypothetical protein